MLTEGTFKADAPTVCNWVDNLLLSHGADGLIKPFKNLLMSASTNPYSMIADFKISKAAISVMAKFSVTSLMENRSRIQSASIRRANTRNHSQNINWVNSME